MRLVDLPAMTRGIRISLTVLRLIYAALWTSVIFGPPPPRHSEPAAEAFWVALEATKFMVPLLGACYFCGGVALWFRRTAPLGLALLSPPMLIIILYDILLAKEAGPWIAIALVHAILLWQFRSAFTPLWSFRSAAINPVVSA
jgi:hypothetical protein